MPMKIPWAEALAAVRPDEWIKISEVTHGPMKLRRRCRVVTYLVVQTTEGEEEIEIPEAAGSAIIEAIAMAREGK